MPKADAVEIVLELRARVRITDAGVNVTQQFVHVLPPTLSRRSRGEWVAVLRPSSVSNGDELEAQARGRAMAISEALRQVLAQHGTAQ